MKVEHRFNNNRNKNSSALNKLFAIYKNGEHKGNTSAPSSEKAIKDYILDSGFPKEMLKDKDFLATYSAVIAQKGIHYLESIPTDNDL